MTETREGTDVVEPDDVLRTLAEWHTTLRQWSGSAFIAGEDIGDTDGAREQLYDDLCRLGNETTWMEEQVTRLRSENERLLASMRIVRNDLAALVPVPSADEPQWPEFFSAADYQCLTLALREARAAVELSKEPSNG